MEQELNSIVENIPIEIKQQGKEAIKKYFEDLEKHKQTTQLFEAKVLLVGYGMVGKTSLLKRMIHNEFDEFEKMTEGIRIDHWTFANEKTDNFRVNVWDFGGQEINYPTHQFFLTKRSVYLNVWEHRLYAALPNLAFFDYWLNIANYLGQNSPVFVVQNKIDERYAVIPIQEIQEAFGVQRFIDVSAKSYAGIDDLKKIIQDTVSNLPHVGQTIPTPWLSVRTDLELISTNYISFETYLDICRKYTIDTEEALRISELFHDLGIFFHFRQSALLRNIIFLKHEWITQAVYKVLHNVEIQINLGKFNFSQLAKIWANYSHEQHLHLIELMQIFQMCIPLNETEYLIPELMSPNPPDYEWNKTDNMRFEYSYKFMPAGIMTRLILRLYENMEVFWKSGAVLSYKETRMVVRIFGLERRISFWLKGKQTDEMKKIIEYEFDRIHKEIGTPQPNEMIPCGCSKCQNSNTPQFFGYDLIKKYIDNKQKTILCTSSFENVALSVLLGKANGNIRKPPVLELLMRAIRKLQGRQIALGLGNTENNRNSYLADELTNSDFRVKDQAPWGKSKNGANAGEMDIKIENTKNETVAIIEAFNLDSLNKKIITEHCRKLIEKYDVNGLPENYILVYCENNFSELWEKYCEFVPAINFTYQLTDFKDVSEQTSTVSDIKIAKATHLRNDRQIVVYHLFVNMKVTF